MSPKILPYALLLCLPVLGWSRGIQDPTLTQEGYIKAGYQYTQYNHTPSNNDMAIGGEFSLEKGWTENIYTGLSLSTNQILHTDPSDGDTPFFNSQGEGYFLLSQIYLKLDFGESQLKIGRQFVETPFVHRNDIAMIPSTYEGITFAHTWEEVFNFQALWLNKTAGGIYTDIPEKFTPINETGGLYAVGLSYADEESGLTAQAWRYQLSEYEKYYYIDTKYTGESQDISYHLGLQIAQQDFEEVESAVVLGLEASIGLDDNSYALTIAYNRALQGAVDGSLGNGPFFVNSSYLGIENAGDEGSIFNVGFVYTEEKRSMSYIRSFLSYRDKKTAFANTLELAYSVGDNLDIALEYTYIEEDSQEVQDHIMQIFASYTF